MVNIQAIIVVSRNNVIGFNSVQENWTFILSKATTPARLQKQIRNKKLAKMQDQLISMKYQIPIDNVKHVILAFGNIKETISHLRDENTRELIFNPENRVVVVIIDVPPTYKTITTIYTKSEHKHIISTVSEAAPLRSQWEQ